MTNEYIRNKLLDNFTGNLGYVYDTPSKIICVVDTKMIMNRQKRDNLIIKLNLEGIADSNKSIAKEFGIDKPIMYVIDSLILDDNYLYIKANNCDVLIGSSYLKMTCMCNIYNGNLFLINSKLIGHSTNITTENLIMDRSVVESNEVKLDVNNKLDLMESLIDGKNVFTNYKAKLSTNNSKIKAVFYLAVNEKFNNFPRKNG